MQLFEGACKVRVRPDALPLLLHGRLARVEELAAQVGRVGGGGLSGVAHRLPHVAQAALGPDLRVLAVGHLELDRTAQLLDLEPKLLVAMLAGLALDSEGVPDLLELPVCLLEGLLPGQALVVYRALEVEDCPLHVIEPLVAALQLPAIHIPEILHLPPRGLDGDLSGALLLLHPQAQVPELRPDVRGVLAKGRQLVAQEAGRHVLQLVYPPLEIVKSSVG
mmetsp:Transcript_103613/g.317237  ORF Transcript_103613/g.317237 Transcript_103613/m.317237 type:complete len:221 (-) Transcript_103613:229-891(-)